MDSYEHNLLMKLLEDRDDNETYEKCIDILTSSILPFIALMADLKGCIKSKEEEEIYRTLEVTSLTSILLMLGNNIDDSISTIKKVEEKICLVDKSIRR